MSGNKVEENSAAAAARKEFASVLDNVAERMGLAALVDESLREKWVQLQHVTAAQAERQRMAETMLLIYHAMT